MMDGRVERRKGGRCASLALLLAWLLTLLLAPGAAAQTARLSVAADSVTVGERFEVALVMRTPGSAAAQVLFPDLPTVPGTRPAATYGDAEAYALRRRPPTLEPGGLRTDTALVTMAAFALDRAAVGPVPVQVVVAGDTLQSLAPAVFVPVRRLVPETQPGEDPAEPAALLPPVGFPSRWPMWPFALALLAGLGALAWRFWPRREAAVPADPYGAAVHRLGALETALPAPGADARPFYDAATDAVRRHLAARLGIAAPELTTSELLAQVQASGRLPTDAAERLGALLHRADRAKFAAARLSPEDHRAALADARAVTDGVEARFQMEQQAAQQAAAQQS